MKKAIVGIILSCISIILYGQADAPVNFYNTTRVVGEAPRIDGLISEDSWEQAKWGGGNFIQRSPNDGADPSAQTKFKILYDSKNLYIAIRCYDPDPSKIVSRLSRRDGFDGDRVSVMFDSYYDKRTAFSFTASSSGVKGEEYVSNNGDNWDEKWDPIWYLETSIDDLGWVAEMKIPLSQLRFANKPEHVWGMQLSRYFFRKDEWSLWEPVAIDAVGWVHHFGELRNIKGVKPQKQLEIQPYVVAKTERHLKEDGNPYATGKSSDIEVGVDAKIGITSDITLDLTINPDFGQVEADPSQVNLSAFQLFFPEQRPFFIEGNNILTFPTSTNFDNLFYSRRIGRRPQIRVDTDESGDDDVEEFVDASKNSRILTSMKLTGKNKNGFSWGILESITHRERAEIDSLGVKREETIEPGTNYLIGRVQQDLNEGQTVFGGMVTSVNRKNEENTYDLVDNAFSGGLDITHFFNNRKYSVAGKIAASKVDGSFESITRLQESSERFYQRTDNNYRNVDSARNTLSGTSGTIEFGKRSGKLLFSSGLSWNSPGFEINDVGFLSQTDQITNRSWIRYRIIKPTNLFRTMRIDARPIQTWDFGHNLLDRRLEFDSYFQLKNYWEVGTGGHTELFTASNADLRGGPSIVYPNSSSYWIWAATDNRKKIRFELNPWWRWSDQNFRSTNGWWSRLTLRPTNALNVNITGSVSWSSNELQYVTTKELNNTERYLVANIDQTIYNVSLRVTYVITPNLSVQYWGQPFAASGKYSNFKQITNGSASEYRDRFQVLNTSMAEDADEISIDENGDGVTDYSIDNPNFNFAQFQSNMVLRWEYIPGSTLFLVWTQSRDESPSTNRYSFDHLYNSLFDKYPNNVFLIKYTYRFVL
ncbi:MAG: DUF5916 domain-containing protein [Fulvivirga sp.]|uniref:DUF5916 domain-containing protein n=1 Tax=Fulvivirga sp. TaxID=1931237 RepID=UPI0032EEA015